MHIKMPRTIPRGRPSVNLWPSDSLEAVECCPVCGQTERALLYNHLVDNAFRTAPGIWTLWKCADCSSAYLDPRPTADSIHLAYENYYTHQDAVRTDDYATLSPIRKFRRRLVNGYTNRRYLTSAQPSSLLGNLVAYAMPSQRKVLDRQYRHLPKLPKGGGTLLDVGCGDGSFLTLARTCGWDVVGLDPDPKAVANAVGKGLAVFQGGIEYFDGKRELFDVVTLNHVIEHVYEPVKVLESCNALLKRGGQLWLETPNIESIGHATFRQNWRGLETPRHLVLFNRSSLRQCVINAGFRTVRDRARPNPCVRTFHASFLMATGHSPYEVQTVPNILHFRAAIAGFLGALAPSRREFLTLTARKSDR